MAVLAAVAFVAVAAVVGRAAVRPRGSVVPEATATMGTVARPAPAPSGEGPLVQIALLLDTSSSMDGLIAQAKTQLWRIVNEFSQANRDGRKPRLQLALYEYGNDGLPSSEGWIRRVSALTQDLDGVSEKLFALRTNGGSEFCGMVIRRAVSELEWSAEPDALRLVFIAGNEAFTQGPVDFRDAVREATAKHIRVNTIHCGAGEEEGWRDGARLADGRYLVIDQNRVVADPVAPQDAELAKLGTELNGTYVPYGTAGAAGAARQAAQDSNSRGISLGNLAQRSVSKASNFYSNESWDLVDAVRKNKVQVDKIAAEELPAELKGKDEAEKREWLDGQAKKRDSIRTRIAELDGQRRAFLEGERAKAKGTGADTLDSAMLASIREQAGQSGLSFK